MAEPGTTDQPGSRTHRTGPLRCRRLPRPSEKHGSPLRPLPGPVHPDQTSSKHRRATTVDPFIVQARTALIAAIVSGTLAVALVAADVAWSLEASLEAETDHGWQVLASTHPEDRARDYHPQIPACFGPDLRLVVDNDRPFSAEVEILVTYVNATAKRTETLLLETIELERFSSTRFDLTIPADAFPEPDEERFDPWSGGVFVEAHVGKETLATTICQEESA